MLSTNRAPGLQSPPSKRRRRGGQPGNLNALKNGGRSRQLKLLVAALLVVPETRVVMLQLASRRRSKGLGELQGAVRRNAALLRAASRRRTIRSIQRQSILWRAKVEQTNAERTANQ